MRRLRDRFASHGGGLLLAALLVLSLLARAHVHADGASAAPPCPLCVVLHDTPAPGGPPLGSVAPALVVASMLLLASGRAVPARAPRMVGRAPPGLAVGSS